MVRNSSGRLFQYFGAATVNAASGNIDETNGTDSFTRSHFLQVYLSESQFVQFVQFVSSMFPDAAFTVAAPKYWNSQLYIVSRTMTHFCRYSGTPIYIAL